ncbi:hypothetical protein IW140_001709 [Coemansia sp. RSA 1813]|nr:hypothetical protein EV178_001505 [Coemansia sp. RSA 1646]KAJ1772514.1 hypothetical protein LPJ74_001415 [Coemansia sp. RSA 1843]KAJ2090917.1 hypothetical protein IW138_002321 [Coemansia sp. RSA 986]KAJ2214015.1 hypothetical protein EV179_003370 [Coemansia sp. RSA 487]KAJ2571255.1 hypothetical protein IW140_001709 [Coemansia sp. RSA 1813]
MSEKIRSILWKSGRHNQQQHRDGPIDLRDSDDIFTTDVELAAKIRQSRKKPLGGNPYAMYAPTTNSTQKQQHQGQDGTPLFLAMPPRIPNQSEMHSAYTSMPLSRRNIRFNPWSLLLELLDDPRIALHTNNNTISRGKSLLATIVRLGQVTLDNVGMQRPLLTQYALRSKAVMLLPQNKDDDIILTPSQHVALSQIQFPRFIAEKFANQVAAASLQDEACSNEARQVQWDRSWLSANLAILELQTTFLKHRVLFNKRLDMAQQGRLLISSAFEHAPGLVLNVIMSWNDDYNKILTPYMIHRLCTRYFSDAETIREAIVQAWQMYDWLVYHSHALYQSKPGTDDTHALAVTLFRSLESFDNWAETSRYFNRIQRHPTDPSNALVQRLLMSDHKLVERYMNLTSQLRGHRRHKPRDIQQEHTLEKCI